MGKTSSAITHSATHLTIFLLSVISVIFALHLETFVFTIDLRTNVCYNLFSATMNGRRLVLLTEDCDL